MLAHAKTLLDTYPSSPEGAVGFVDADLRDVTAVIRGAASTLDYHRPVALIMLGILGRIEDHGAARSITSQLLGPLPSGSYLAIADGVSTNDDINRAQLRYNSRLGDIAEAETPYHLRRPDQLASFFDGLDVVEPGVVPCSRWKPDRLASNGADGTAEEYVYCGVARKL